MRLLTGLQEPEQPIEVNLFRMLVPEAGYCWLDDAVPSPSWGEDNWRALGSGPYMAVNGLGVPAQVHDPLAEWPDLFLKFKDLGLDRDSLLQFADSYGWIGERGRVDGAKGNSLNVVGFDTWLEEIRAMMVADRFLNLARIKDQQELSRYFVWDRFEVRARFEIDGKTIRPFKPGSEYNPRGSSDYIQLAGTLVMPEDEAELSKLGWRRGDFTRPALGFAAELINKRLGQWCQPALMMDHKNARLRGYWTAKNLLGCIWLQFYLSVIGQLHLRRCTVCGEEMDVTHSRKSRRVHARCSRNRRQARWRAKRKAALSPNSEDLLVSGPGLATDE